MQNAARSAIRDLLPERSQEKNAPENMEGLQRRFVKFGGKVSSGQLAWLRGQLRGAAAAGQQVLVCSHQPLHPDSVLENYTTLCWNYDEVSPAFLRKHACSRDVRRHAMCA